MMSKRRGSRTLSMPRLEFGKVRWRRGLIGPGQWKLDCWYNENGFCFCFWAYMFFLGLYLVFEFLCYFGLTIGFGLTLKKSTTGVQKEKSTTGLQKKDLVLCVPRPTLSLGHCSSLERGKIRICHSTKRKILPIKLSNVLNLGK
ncbi:hypothetical protein HS088_TW11G00091 [Tripterygium wilfordii]|uniref:Uncharacterized protein n=1 Tax=Tripterygium wilfordii TaxID=458696 RepID=A0A7J7D180_TRIWF|nr:hypothetical protein HS088_TW11G00091 [Tripterygium wilfordii]